MEIIFHGRHDGHEATESLLSIIRLLNEQYHVSGFREMHLSVTLVDDTGADVELIDSDTEEAYRMIEVYHQGRKTLSRRKGRPALNLVVNK